MDNMINGNIIAEVKHYLKGIKQKDIDKLPKKLIQYINNNASRDYKCNFDYNAPLKDISILDATRGFIGMICYNYWCDTEELKKQFLKKLNENEIKYQEKLKKDYEYDNLFRNNITKTREDEKENVSLVNIEDGIFQKIIKKIKSIFFK